VQVEFSSPCSDGESIWFASLEVPKVAVSFMLFLHVNNADPCTDGKVIYFTRYLNFCSFLPSKRVPKSRVTLRTASLFFLENI
jgi:hypothetical protein